jgi:hypothetical protein
MPESMMTIYVPDNRFYFVPALSPCLNPATIFQHLLYSTLVFCHQLSNQLTDSMTTDAL